jgi:hypothetical protein
VVLWCTFVWNDAGMSETAACVNGHPVTNALRTTCPTCFAPVVDDRKGLSRTRPDASARAFKLLPQTPLSALLRGAAGLVALLLFWGRFFGDDPQPWQYLLTAVMVVASAVYLIAGSVGLGIQLARRE